MNVEIKSGNWASFNKNWYHLISRDRFANLACNNYAYCLEVCVRLCLGQSMNDEIETNVFL